MTEMHVLSSRWRNWCIIIEDAEYSNTLDPIIGYAQEPLLPLGDACAPLVDIVSEILQYVSVALEKAPKYPPDGLTHDESAAICLYTMEWPSSAQSLYRELNQTLTKSNREALRPWFKYLKLFLTALAKIPCTSPQVVWRGITRNISSEFPDDNHLTWWGFTSCTVTLPVLQNNMYLGNEGERTLLSIETINGRSIHNHSYFESEDEVLLLPGTYIEVQSKFNPASDLHIIHLKQRVPEQILLEPPFEGAHLYPRMKSSRRHQYCKKRFLLPICSLAVACILTAILVSIYEAKATRSRGSTMPTVASFTTTITGSSLCVTDSSAQLYNNEFIYSPSEHYAAGILNNQFGVYRAYRNGNVTTTAVWIAIQSSTSEATYLSAQWDRNLAVYTVDGDRLVWASDSITADSSESFPFCLQMLDSGNLVWTDRTNSTIWQTNSGSAPQSILCVNDSTRNLYNNEFLYSPSQEYAAGMLNHNFGVYRAYSSGNVTNSSVWIAPQSSTPQAVYLSIQVSPSSFLVSLIGASTSLWSVSWIYSNRSPLCMQLFDSGELVWTDNANITFWTSNDDLVATDTNYSSALTANSSWYTRYNSSGGYYYYEAIQVTVTVPGIYTFISVSDIDTFGYLYASPINTSDLSQNLIDLDDDNIPDVDLQFRMKAWLQINNTYIVLFTTYAPSVTGAFSMVVQGSAKVTLEHIYLTLAQSTTIPD